MPWGEILLALIRCELKARRDWMGNWQLSVRGAFPMLLLALGALIVWGRSIGQ
jgi:hypothetical protein